jgi:hypothetical protein
LPTCYAPVRRAPSVLLRTRTRLACVKHAASVRSEPGSNSHVKLAAWKIKKPEHPIGCRTPFQAGLLIQPGPGFPSELFNRSIHSIFGIFMPKLIERVLAHLILPSLSKSDGLLSSRQANLQPNEDSICILNVKHQPRNSLLALWKSVRIPRRTDPRQSCDRRLCPMRKTRHRREIRSAGFNRRRFRRVSFRN